eukprot:scaffold63144_cov27-Tisochrysis_lutea.AAC.1
MDANVKLVTTIARAVKHAEAVESFLMRLAARVPPSAAHRKGGGAADWREEAELSHGQAKEPSGPLAQGKRARHDWRQGNRHGESLRAGPLDNDALVPQGCQLGLIRVRLWLCARA